MEENKHYELIPADDGGVDIWNVRILTGYFNETVIRFGNIRIDPDNISYNYIVVSSPIEDVTPEDEELQKVASDILVSVLEQGFKDKSIMTREVDK